MPFVVVCCLRFVSSGLMLVCWMLIVVRCVLFVMCCSLLVGIDCCLSCVLGCGLLRGCHALCVVVCVFAFVMFSL